MPGVRSPGPGAGTVLVVGGTGFIGSAVVGELLTGATGPAPAVRVLTRAGRPAGEWPGTGGVEYVAGDLEQPATLRGVCSGVTALVHAASYVGRDRALCRRVNHVGSLALLAEAQRAGTARILYVSTASVYGIGPHRGPREGELAPAPVSAASASRLRAERAVRAAGGVVLRPHLVHGPGDRWFIPTLARLLSLVPGWPAGQTSYNSVIAVQDLARVVAALVRAPGWDGGEVYHVADTQPVRMAGVAAALSRELGLPGAVGGLSPAGYRALALRAMPGLSEHQYALLTEDHWYDCGRIWRRTGLDPGPGFARRFADHAGWYAAGLRRPGAAVRGE